jgi:hypothetical protein
LISECQVINYAYLTAGGITVRFSAAVTKACLYSESLPCTSYCHVCLSVYLSIYIYLSIYLYICLSVCLSVRRSVYLSVCLWFYNPLLDLGRFFSFLILCTVGRTPRTGGSARRKAATYTGQHKHKINVYTDIPCLEWDSNSRSQCSSDRRQFMPYCAATVTSFKCRPNFFAYSSIVVF